MTQRATSRRRPSSSQPPLDAFLGIDLGTTSTRARLIIPDTRQTYDILRTTGATRNARFAEGEFSSTIYPIDGNEPYYNGNVTAPGRASLSAKISFPSLVGNEVGLELHQEGYALVLAHLEMLMDSGARERAKMGINALFKTISRCLDIQLSRDNRKVTVKAFGLSIPAHWTLEYEDLYRSIVKEAFSNFQGDIFFLTEAEALARYLFRDHHELLVKRNKVRGRDGDVALIMDFGGDNMNGCIIDIACGSNSEQPGFYELTKPQGN